MSNNTAWMRKRDEIRARLIAIENARGGRLRPEDVLADAQDEDSPLHDQFQWDDQKAGHAWRIAQARELITSIKVTVTTETRSVRSVCYVHDPSLPSGEQGYVSIRRLQSDEEMTRKALCDEFRRAGDLLMRARTLAVALGAEAEIEQLIKSVVGLRDRYCAPQTQQ